MPNQLRLLFTVSLSMLSLYAPAQSSTTPTSTAKAFRDCPECPLMMPIEGGTYTMGDASGEKDECPHSETVASFSIGQYEVTVEEYLRFADATNTHYPRWLEKGNEYNVETGNKTYYKEKGYARTAKSLPVSGVNWDDAVAYCEWLSKKTGKKYRLPLEKEWEYAAKGGKKTRGFKYSGSKAIEDVAWYIANADGKPHPVGGKAANELGLYDMSGNMWEWCQEKWAPYPGCIARECSEGAVVLRGGSWINYDPLCRSANRIWHETLGLNFFHGFRCARDGQ